MESQINANDTAACKRCGTCCRKGGPALHVQDKALIDQGKIMLKDLFTIRKGELARDNIKGSLVPAESDIIKIKGSGSSWRCCFLAKNGNDCEIYDNRPFECRLLSCQDTSAIEEIYTKDRLTREDLLAGVAGLWDLVCAHEKKCSYEHIGLFAVGWEKNNAEAALKALVELIAYDRQLRQLVAQKMNRAGAMTDLLFGRPLTETIHMFGITAKWQDDKWCLGRTDKPDI
jgi:Fe-S-cluster containining protein